MFSTSIDDQQLIRESYVTYIFNKVSLRIGNDFPVGQPAFMYMLNCMINILIYIRSIKLQFLINKVLHNICNQACLEGSIQMKFEKKWNPCKTEGTERVK